MVSAELQRILKLLLNDPTIKPILKPIRQPVSNKNNQEVSYAPLCITVPRYQKGKIVGKLFATYTVGFDKTQLPYLSRNNFFLITKNANSQKMLSDNQL